ncbi:MAG: hypothetical protein H3C48_02105 [Chitinophagaceae bacterium]|nr:hypothetical protein [Chitinophagaceae bacterium]
MRRLWSCAMVCTLMIIGCTKKYYPGNTPFSIYRPIAEDDVRKLEKGASTTETVIRLFGEPERNNISNLGERFVYGYLGDTLTVLFDNNSILSSFIYRPAFFEPVEGYTDNNRKKINTRKIEKIQVYNTTRYDLEKWFGKASKKEQNSNRIRYTFYRKNGTLVVYVLNNFEERVLNYHFTPS